jgi:hypothetical protein
LFKIDGVVVVERSEWLERGVGERLSDGIVIGTEEWFLLLFLLLDWLVCGFIVLEGTDGHGDRFFRSTGSHL